MPRRLTRISYYLLTRGSSLSAVVGGGVAFGLALVAASFLQTIDRSHVNTPIRKAVARYRNELKQQDAGNRVQQHVANVQGAQTRVVDIAGDPWGPPHPQSIQTSEITTLAGSWVSDLNSSSWLPIHSRDLAVACRREYLLV